MILVPKFEPEASCDFAVEFLRSQPKDQPFFLTVQMGPPHDPYGAPAEYMSRYDPEQISVPENWQPDSEVRAGGPLIPPRLRRLGMPEGNYVTTGGREEIAAYYAAITAIDDQVGRLMDVLRETGADENTIILFTSDHGDMLGSHGLRRKRKPHDESARVPGIIRWPGRVPEGSAVDALFSHVDMAPTLLGLAGFEVPKRMQGADLSRVALGETTAGPEAVLLQIFVPYNPDGIAKPWRGIVTADHTYARYEDEPWVLFDHQRDPAQMTNLVNSRSADTLLGELDTRLTALMEEHDDDWSFNSNELVEEGGRLYRHETFYTIDEYLEWAKANPE
jgi:arylsulfatase A-like enzyme